MSLAKEISNKVKKAKRHENDLITQEAFMLLRFASNFQAFVGRKYDNFFAHGNLNWNSRSSNRWLFHL